MNTQQKIFVDRAIGTPLVVLCNLAARILGKLLRRDHRIAPEAVHCIAVAKFAGMGSIVQATPLLRMLKARFPQARLLFLTAVGNRPLLERLDMVDETICVDDTGLLPVALTSLRAWVTLLRRHPDLYIDLEVYSAYSCLMSLLSLARNRLGFYRHSTRFKRGIYTHLMYFNTRKPVRRIYRQLGRMTGVDDGAADVLGPISVSEADRRGAWEKMAAAGLKPGERYIAVNSNASDLLAERRWPVARFAAVIEQLAADGLRTVLLGAAGDAAQVAKVESFLSSATRARLVNMTGRLEMGELLAVLEGAACVLTNDSGPMHLAIALDRPTVCLFGPGDPAHYGFARDNVVTLYHPVFCSPCIYEIDTPPPCDGKNVCMERIGVAEVVGAVRRLLSPTGTEAPAAPQGEADTCVDDNGKPLGMVRRASAQT